MRPLDRTPHKHQHARWLLAAVLSLVLWSQWGALVHSVIHPGSSGSPVAVFGDAGGPRPAAHGLHELFGDHDTGSSLCRLLDQLTQPGTVSSAVVLATADTFESAPCNPPRTSPQAALVLRYHARAPPARA